MTIDSKQSAPLRVSALPERTVAYFLCMADFNNDPNGLIGVLNEVNLHLFFQPIFVRAHCPGCVNCLCRIHNSRGNVVCPPDTPGQQGRQCRIAIYCRRSAVNFH